MAPGLQGLYRAAREHAGLTARAGPCGAATGTGGEKRHGRQIRQFLRSHRRRRRAGRLCGGDPGRPARPQDRAGRARASRRHLPQLGLHPDQGVAAHVGNLPPDAACRRFRPVGGQCFLRYRQGGETLAQGCRPAQRRRQASDEEEQGRGVRRPRPAGRQGQGRRRQGRQGNRHPVVAPDYPRHRRPGAHAAGASSPTARTSGPTRKPWCRRPSRNRY